VVKKNERWDQRTRTCMSAAPCELRYPGRGKRTKPACTHQEHEKFCLIVRSGNTRFPDHFPVSTFFLKPSASKNTARILPPFPGKTGMHEGSRENVRYYQG
jgi:hypothetical protein